MTATLADRPRQAAPDASYIVIPTEAWLNQTAYDLRPLDAEDFDEAEEDDYYFDAEKEPMALSTFTGLGGASGSLAFGVVAGIAAGSPAGLVAGVAAGIFGGLMGRSVAEEIYERKHES